MITRYMIMLRLDFDSAIQRDNIFTKIKTALATTKIADPQTTGSLSKDEYSKPDQTTETVQVI